MGTFLEILPIGNVPETLRAKIKLWAGEIIKGAGGEKRPERLSIFLWERTGDFEEFDAREKAELEIATTGDADFLATHEAWRGYPRIHIPIEKVRGLSEDLIRGIVQHEIGHALLHGSQEFYQFRFSPALQTAGSRMGLDWPMLQQLIYLLSVALKDAEVMRFLSQQGVGIYQSRFLEYLLKETEEEKQIWKVIREDPALSQLGMAVFLKTRLPIEALDESIPSEAGCLIQKWEAAYAWLSHEEKTKMNTLARFALANTGSFQDRLEAVALWLMDKASS
jgi:hypothetical protein